MIGLVGAAAMALAADKYPSRPIHWVVGFAAGGPNDTTARIFGDWLANRLGQPVVVEDRTGQGGMIAANYVLKAAPDGYTVMFVAPNNAIGTSLYKHLPFDFQRDTVPIAMFMQVPNMMVVSNAMPAKTVKEFIDYCKANPGKISYASSGNGTSVHMTAELFKAMTKCDMLHVPYRGCCFAEKI